VNARFAASLANALTAVRVFIAVPLMLGCAAVGAREAFVWVLAVSFCTDAIDGPLARLSGTANRFGAKFDTWADVTAYAAIALAVTVLWPDLVREQWLAFGAIVASFVVPSVVGLAKFGSFTSYHTRLVKLAVVVTALALLVVLTGGPRWLLRVAAVVDVLAALEEIAISCLLDAPRSDVGGVVRVWRAKRGR